MKLVRVATMVALFGVAVAFAGVGIPSGAHSATSVVTRSITVSGMGTVTTVPDRAQVSFGVSSDAKTATAALNANAAEMAKVIAALKGAGIAAADIQTQAVSLSPKYSEGGEVVIGYTVTNTVLATVKNLDKTGTYIDAAVAAGANQVNGPNLIRSDQSALYQQALKNAIADARAKATTIAAASAIKLGRVVNVVEGFAPSPVPLGVSSDAARATPTPIEPGTSLVQATLTVTFAVV
jgi:uncharacterized protein YggE